MKASLKKKLRQFTDDEQAFMNYVTERYSDEQLIKAKTLNLGELLSPFFQSKIDECQAHDDVSAWGAPGECHGDVARSYDEHNDNLRIQLEAISGVPVWAIAEEIKARLSWKKAQEWLQYLPPYEKREKLNLQIWKKIEDEDGWPESEMYENRTVLISESERKGFLDCMLNRYNEAGIPARSGFRREKE